MCQVVQKKRGKKKFTGYYLLLHLSSRGEEGRGGCFCGCVLSRTICTVARCTVVSVIVQLESCFPKVRP